MMIGELMKVRIYDSIETGEIYFLFYWEKGNERDVIHFSNGQMQIDTIPIGQKCEPSFRLPFGALKPLGDAIAEFGIKLDSDMKREGLLEATKYHLEDMRKLIFEKKIY